MAERLERCRLYDVADELEADEHELELREEPETEFGSADGATKLMGEAGG